VRSKPSTCDYLRPSGVGKTAAARVILEEAKKSELSPFKKRQNSWKWMQLHYDSMKEVLPIR